MAEARRWTEGESRQVLELYQRLPFGKFHQTNPDVIALAAAIQRTPAAIAMKLSNFAILDSKVTNTGRKGLSETTELDRKVWSEFCGSVTDDAANNQLSMPSGRVWVTSFWGFNPEQDGYFGFTREGDRTAFLRSWRRGDLVIVYATMSDQADPDDRGRVMGFLEVEPKTIRDTDRMAPAGVTWKVNHRVTDRWTYAVPVVRAWRSVDKPLVRDLAPVTLGPGANFRLIAGRGLFLQPDEAAAALSIALRPVQPFGGVPLADEETTKVYTPSKGFPMSFGKRSFETRDGAHFLYALQLAGDVAALIDGPAHALRGKVVVKVGLAKDPNSRCAQHNACLPPGGKLRWKVALRSREFADGDAALAAETALKGRFARVSQSLGGEFFLCDESTLTGEFLKAQRCPDNRLQEVA